MRFHLFGVPVDEAQRSLDVHGHVETCSKQECAGDAVAMLMVRSEPGQPGAIGAIGVCGTHEAEVLADIKAEFGNTVEAVESRFVAGEA